MLRIQQRRTFRLHHFTRSYVDQREIIRTEVSDRAIPFSARHKAAIKAGSLPESKGDDLRLKEYISHNLSSYERIQKFSDLPTDFGYNQHIAIDRELRENLRSILWQFQAPIRYAFAYGSGVFSQGISTKTTPQIDLIFGVTHTEHFHSLNTKHFPHHYSSAKYLGSGAISWLQDNVGAGVYFNPFVEMNGLKIKYGVVNIETLTRDLANWETLYLGGRLHKPVKILRDVPQVRFVNQANLIAAIRTSLLLLPEEFTELDFYTTVASLSYRGDFRMVFGENPNKVKNIVHNQFLNFRRLYSPILDELLNVELVQSDVNTIETDGKSVPYALLKQDMSPKRRGNIVQRLPSTFQKNLYDRFAKYGTRAADGTLPDDFNQNIASDPNLTREIGIAVKNTVRYPAMTQSLKGLITAGPERSFRYLSEKLGKRSAK